MLLLRAKREEEEEGGEGEERRVYVAAVCSGLRSRLGVRSRAIWSQLETEQRAPGPVLLEQPSARPFNPPDESLSGREGLERVQWRCMFLFCFFIVVGFYWEGTREQEEKKGGRKTTKTQ